MITKTQKNTTKSSKFSVLWWVLGAIVGVPVILFLVIEIWFAYSTQKDYRAGLAAQEAIYNRAALPAGYQLKSKNVESTSAPIGSFDATVYEISAPAGKTRQAVYADFLARFRPGKSVNPQANYDNTMLVGNNVTVSFKPYLDPDSSRPDQTVLNLTLSIK